MTLTPLSWLAFFAIRFLKEWKSKKMEKKENPNYIRKKEFKDPNDYLS